MSKKKELAIITMSEATNHLFKEQLTEVLKDKVNIVGYVINDLEEVVQVDLILSTNSLNGKVNKYVSKDSEVVFARRSLDISSLEKLIKISTGKQVLLVNNTKLAAQETETILKEAGIDHIELILSYPGKEVDDEIKLAITPEEVEYVPEGVEQIIDIGSRVLDLTTIVEVLIKLNLLDEKANLLVSKHIRQLVKLNKELDTNIKKVEKANKMLETVINHVHDGIIYINKREEVEVFNQMAEDFFEIKAEDVINKNVVDKVPNTKLHQVLRTGLEDINALQNVGDKKIVTTRVLVKQDEAIIGALATFKDITEVKKLEQNLRKKLKDKGHIAKYRFNDIIGESEAINKAIKKAKNLAKSESTILIQGESGTGKELFAQAIHNYSNRAEASFVAINCAAIPESLLESELFGYEDGAFTGAKKGGRPGVFEQAHTGTIFLDEIGDMPLNIQTRLLRVLQEKEVMRIGATKVAPIDIRVIAATNKDLKRLINENKFREDLYYRLNVLPLEIPNLNNRREDIPLLINFFLQRFNREDLVITKGTMSKLYNYNWEGNIRELENCVEYITQTCNNKVRLDALPPYLKNNHRINDGDLDELEKIKVDLKELGDIIEYKLILNELYLAKQLDEHIGRREIAKSAKINEVQLSSQMVRSRLKKLEKQGLVKIGRGRQGTEITDKGIQILKKLNS